MGQDHVDKYAAINWLKKYAREYGQPYHIAKIRVLCGDGAHYKNADSSIKRGMEILRIKAKD